ncbi:MAG: tetratricopeptide repeat protein [Elusimicrobiota bacterium]
MEPLEALGRLVSTGRSSVFGMKRYLIMRKTTPALKPAQASPHTAQALKLLTSRPRSDYSLAPHGINRVAKSSSAVAAAKSALSEALIAVRRHPKNPLGPIVCALACEDLNRPKDAIRWFSRAVALAPKEGWILLARADARRRAGDLDGFVRDATAAHYLGEGAGAFRFAVADPRSESVPLAIAGATKYLKRHPRAGWALALRADLKRFPEINDFPGALADFEAAARLSPKEGWIHAYLSRARITGGDSAGALAAVTRAADLRPDCGWIRAWKGEVLRRLGRHQESLRELDLAVRLDPNYEFSYAWRGGTRRCLGLFKEALSDLNVSTALDPSYAWAFVERHLVLRALGRVAEALGDLEYARRSDPKNAWCPRSQGADAALRELDAYLSRRPRDARAHAWRGETLLRSGDAAGAELSLSRAVRLDSSLSWARGSLGEALLLRGKPKEAIRAFDAALKADPTRGELLARRGRARLDSGDARGAFSDLTAAAEREPRAAWIHGWRGEAALTLKRWADARASFRQASGLDRKDVNSRLGEIRALRGAGKGRAADAIVKEILRQAEALTGAGRHDDAIWLCTAVLSVDPRRREALAVRAEAYRCLGHHQDAVADHDRLVQLSRRDIQSLLSRGAARRAAFDFLGALSDAEAALRLRPRAVSGWILKAEALRALGREAQALLAAEKACALEPRRSWAWTVRAKAARQSGALNDALSFAARACALDPRDAKAWAWKGDVLRALGRLPEARRCLARAVALAPSVAWPLAVLAEVLRESGDSPGAVELWARALRTDPRASSAYDMLGAEPESVARDPGRAWAYAWRGTARGAAGDEKGAEADTHRARVLAPGLFSPSA